MEIYFSLVAVVLTLVSVYLGYWMGARQTDKPIQGTVIERMVPKPPVMEPEGTIFDEVRGDNLS